MAISLYTDEQTVRAHLAKQNINHDDQLLRVIGAATDYIDRRTGRAFRLTEASEREYPVSLNRAIYVVDLIAPTNDDVVVEVDTVGDGTFATPVGSPSFRLEPRTGDDGSAALRFQRIVPVYTGPDASYIKGGYRALVTGDWGYVEGPDLAPPDGVQYACLLLVARWYKRRESPASVTAMPGWGIRQVMAQDTDANDILDEFIHPMKRLCIR